MAESVRPRVLRVRFFSEVTTFGRRHQALGSTVVFCFLLIPMNHFRKKKKLAVCATISHDNVRINLPQLGGREGCRGNQQSDRGETACTWILRSLWCSFPKASLAWQKTCNRRYEGWTGLSCGREPIAKRGHIILWKRMSNDNLSLENRSRNSCSNSE